MKQETFTLKNRSLLSKLLLTFALIVGANSAAWADTTIFNGNIGSDWTNSGFTQGTNEIYTTWKTSALTSTSKVNLPEGSKLIINAKGGSTASAQLHVKMSNEDSPSWESISATASFNSSANLRKNTTDYIDLSVDIVSTGNYFLYFTGSYVTIKSIAIEDPVGEITELVFDENSALPEGFSSLSLATEIDDVYVKYTPTSGWNTICMPFQLKGNVAESDKMESIFGSGWSAYAFSDFSDGVLTFSKRTANLSMGANIPYLVYSSNPQTKPEAGFHFQNVEVTYSNNPRYKNGNAIFQGTYVRKDFAVNDNWYGVTSSGQVMKAGTGAYVKGYRAYFTGVSAPTTPGARIAIVIEGEGDTTDLGFVKMVDEESKDKDVYTLSGMKVTKAGKGIYIVNGKKIVIK